MAPKVIFYMGAPTYEEGNWDSVQLLSELDESFLQFARVTEIDSKAEKSPPRPPTSTSRDNSSAWRSLAYLPVHLPTGFSQPQFQDFNYPQRRVDSIGESSAAASYWTKLETQCGTRAMPYSFQNTEGTNDDDEFKTQFYDHSIAIHESQSLLENNDCVEISSLPTTSFTSDMSISFISDAGDVSQFTEPLGNRSRPLTTLENIPPPNYVTSVYPATISVDLVVGIISLSPSRTVQTKWGPKELIELIAGDETKSGFAVTFWLSDTIRKSLSGLRRQDVVLLRNVALATFRNKVHGNSLRRDVTKVYLLYRKKLDDKDTSGHYSPSDILSSRPAHLQLERTRRVREWILRFVGPSLGQGSRVQAKPWDRMPDDSQ